MQAILHKWDKDLPWHQSIVTSAELMRLVEPSVNLHGLRKRSREKFTRDGFPTSSKEEWKYTNFAAVLGGNESNRGFHLTDQHYLPTEQDLSLVRSALSGLPTPQFVFINGILAACDTTNSCAFSLHQLLKSHGDIANALPAEFGAIARYEDNSLLAFNSAAFTDAVVISIPKQRMLESPIHIVWATTQSDVLVCPRVFISAAEKSGVSVIETHLALSEAGHLDERYFNCGVTEIIVGESATVEHSKLVFEGGKAVHFGGTFIDVRDRAKFTSNVFSSGGAVVRNEVYPVLNGENSETYLNGFTAIGDAQHVDNFTLIDHAQPNCFSRELYKGLYDDRSSGAFSGTILVRPGAQKTNAIQSNRSILLSDQATANAQPQLKIYADDVKCTHGATVGQLDCEALFYLRSRGIRETEARSILMRAFAEEVFEDCSIKQLRDWLSTAMLKRV